MSHRIWSRVKSAVTDINDQMRQQFLQRLLKSKSEWMRRLAKNTDWNAVTDLIVRESARAAALTVGGEYVDDLNGLPDDDYGRPIEGELIAAVMKNGNGQAWIRNGDQIEAKSYGYDYRQDEVERTVDEINEAFEPAFKLNAARAFVRAVTGAKAKEKAVKVKGRPRVLLHGRKG